ncbi:hypothetical protein FQN54_007616 [Arachnomyces sp. PD_36]|nr:hypothetical protein FQN54_007616 [Arachnomyces sp. PD_36]
MEKSAGEGSPAPSPNAIKKVFKSSRTKTVPYELGSTSDLSKRRSSIGSQDNPRPATSGGAIRTDDNARSTISKLIPGARRRRRKREASGFTAQREMGSDSDLRWEKTNDSREDISGSGSNNGSQSTLGNDTGSSLLADNSEPEAPPTLTARNSHVGYLTSSSPLITTTAVDGSVVRTDNSNGKPGGDSAADLPRQSKRRSATISASTSDEINRSVKEAASRSTRDLSTGQKLKEAFGHSANNSASTSPDREPVKQTESRGGLGIFGGRRRGSLGGKRPKKPTEEPPPMPPMPSLVRTHSPEELHSTPNNPPPVDTGPKTPPIVPAPETTVTPPTPTEGGLRSVEWASIQDLAETSKKIPSNLPPNAVVSPSGNMISHRRVRSASAAHPPSKLSNSVSVPLTPTIEEVKAANARTPSASPIGTGFLSSMFSVAQNAATTLSTSLNGPTKTRSSTETAPEEDTPTVLDSGAGEAAQPEAKDPESGEKKELAVDTLGMGDLSFSHLGLDGSGSSSVMKTKDGMVFTKADTTSDGRKGVAAERDELAAKIEDMRAARAVSMAYEKHPEESASTLLADDTADPHTGGGSLPASLKDGSGEQSPHGGSIFEGEAGVGRARSGSLRGRLAHRRHRGSSGATGASVGAIGMNSIALGLPGINSSVPRLTGFAVASKKRNRDFHQLFRSVPEDDYLIEDYSCALQREIILAGRIYVSEGHICFSSNILGWVTTLVISFDEVMAIEKENTAMVFPNAIAIQTLHARHTFRSLLSRESTYDLMVNIWKINHPALKSSVNGTHIKQGTGDKTEKAEESDVSEGVTDDEDEVYDEDEEGEGGESFVEAGEGSVSGSDIGEPGKRVIRKPSTPGINGAAASAPALTFTEDTKGGDKGAGATSEGSADFPGPKTHAPTEYTDPAGKYERVVKDETIPAPLGQIYTLVFGPSSGSFISKFLLNDQKVTELQFDDDKKGLSNDSRSRSYSYIKPLNASIGPKQTKCITNENLDFLDLEKAVLVTMTTQTPDVPSGNVFSVKTKYLLTWAPGNATRFYMSCTIEWTGKSWIKGPIEKGANDGQLSYGTDLVQCLKTRVAPKGRLGGAKGGPKSGKGRRKKGDAAEKIEAAAAAGAALEASKRQSESWGLLEPLHGPLGPVVDLFRPLWTANVALVVISVLLFMVLFRRPATSPGLATGVGYPGLSVPERIVAYEEMWRREENELWDWLEERVGTNGFAFPAADRTKASEERLRLQRRNVLGGDFEARLQEEKMTEREMTDAIRVTKERLEVLEGVIGSRKEQVQKGQETHS